MLIQWTCTKANDPMNNTGWAKHVLGHKSNNYIRKQEGRTDVRCARVCVGLCCLP